MFEQVKRDSEAAEYEYLDEKFEKPVADVPKTAPEKTGFFQNQRWIWLVGLLILGGLVCFFWTKNSGTAPVQPVETPKDTPAVQPNPTHEIQNLQTPSSEKPSPETPKPSPEIKKIKPPLAPKNQSSDNFKEKIYASGSAVKDSLKIQFDQVELTEWYLFLAKTSENAGDADAFKKQIEKARKENWAKKYQNRFDWLLNEK